MISSFLFLIPRRESRSRRSNVILGLSSTVRKMIELWSEVRVLPRRAKHKLWLAPCITEFLGVLVIFSFDVFLTWSFGVLSLQAFQGVLDLSSDQAGEVLAICWYFDLNFIFASKVLNVFNTTLYILTNRQEGTVICHLYPEVGWTIVWDQICSLCSPIFLTTASYYRLVMGRCIFWYHLSSLGLVPAMRWYIHVVMSTVTCKKPPKEHQYIGSCR